MKWFSLIISLIVLFNTYDWLSSYAHTDVIMPTPQQLNEMVGREGLPRVPLWLANAGN